MNSDSDDTLASELLYPFPDEIIIQDRDSAIQFARHIVDRDAMERYLVMWVDASVQPFPPTKKANRMSAVAVAYLDFPSMEWKDLITINTLRYGTRFSIEAELMAIREAFRIACELTDVFDRLLIFSDCQTVLEGIKARRMFHYLPKKDVLYDVFTYANSLYDLGILVELRWIPSHSIEGNERVDELANQCRRTAQALLAQTRQDVILKDVALSSPEELHQTLRSQIIQQIV
jgi:ribonuclease HI